MVQSAHFCSLSTSLWIAVVPYSMAAAPLGLVSSATLPGSSISSPWLLTIMIKQYWCSVSPWGLISKGLPAGLATTDCRCLSLANFPPSHQPFTQSIVLQFGYGESTASLGPVQELTHTHIEDFPPYSQSDLLLLRLLIIVSFIFAVDLRDGLHLLHKSTFSGKHSQN